MTSKIVYYMINNNNAPAVTRYLLAILYISFLPSSLERTLWVSKAFKSRISTSGSQRLWRMWRLIGVRLGFSSELEEFCNKTTKKRILGSFFDILYLKFQGRIFIFFTNKQARVSPLDIEISIESNAEVLVRHLGNVLLGRHHNLISFYLV